MAVQPPPPPAQGAIPPPLRPYTNTAPFNTSLQNLCNEHNAVLQRNYVLECRLADLATNATALLSGQSLQPSADLSTRVASLRAGLQTTLDHSLAGLGQNEVEKGVEILAVVNDLMARDGRMSEALMGVLMKRAEGTLVKTEDANEASTIEGLRGDVDFLGMHFGYVRGELDAVRMLQAASLKKNGDLIGELDRSRKLAEFKDKMLVLRTKEKTIQDAALGRHNKAAAEKNAALAEKEKQIQALKASVAEKDSHVQNLNAKVTRLEGEQNSRNFQNQAPRAAPALQQHFQGLRPTASTYVPFDYTPDIRPAPPTQSLHQSVTLELQRLQSEVSKSKSVLQEKVEQGTRQRKELASNSSTMQRQAANINAQKAQIAELNAHIATQEGLVKELRAKLDVIDLTAEHERTDVEAHLKRTRLLDDELREAKERINRRDTRIDKQLRSIEDLQGKLAERERFITYLESIDPGHESCQRDVRRCKDEIAALIEQVAIADAGTDHTSCLADVKKCTDEIRLLGRRLFEVDRDRTEARRARDEANLGLHEMKTRLSEKEALLQSLREELAAATLVLEGMAAERTKPSRASSPARAVKAEPIERLRPSAVACGVAEHHECHDSEQIGATDGLSAADSGSTRSVSCTETHETLATATSECSVSDSVAGMKSRKRSEPASEVYLPPQKRACGRDGANDAPEPGAVIRGYDRKAFVAKWTREWRPEAELDY